jgi:hypothetical protein
MLPTDRKLDFFIVGAQKAGTTSLYNYMSQHEDIFLPFNKDFFAFNDDPHYGVSELRLPQYYREYAGQEVIGGSNVQVLPFETAIGTLHAYRPDIKIVVMLRNPIDRAHSAFWMMRRAGLEPCETFEAALKLDADRGTSDDFRTRAELRYIDHGFYDQQLANVFRFFKPEQVHIALFDDLANDPQETTGSILSWLGVTSGDKGIDFGFRSNESSMPQSPKLESLIRSQGPWKRAYHRVVPLRLRILVNERVISRMEESILQPFQYPGLARTTRERLLDLYRPHLERLSALLGRDLGQWQRLD